MVNNMFSNIRSTVEDQVRDEFSLQHEKIAQLNESLDEKDSTLRMLFDIKEKVEQL